MGRDSSSMATRRAVGGDRGDRLGAPRHGRLEPLPVAQGAGLRLVDLAHHEGRSSGVGQGRDRHPLALPGLEVGERVGVGDARNRRPGCAAAR